MDKEDFYYASGRTEAYTVIEVCMFEGRTVVAKKQLLKLLFKRINNEFRYIPSRC